MSGYIGSTPVPQATQHRESFTATSGQTTFATAGYTAGFVDVYLNGSHLSPADFVATNGSDVVLVSGCGADDVCDIISHSAFEINAQTFTGTTTMDVVTATGVVTANAGVVVDEMTLDADTLTATDDFIIDAAGEIVLDSATGITQYKDGGTEFLRITESSGDVVIQSAVQDKKIFFSGDDAGAGVNALVLDMQNAGAATFNTDVILGNAKSILFGDGSAKITGDGSAETLKFFTSGAERARFSAAGDLMVGGTNGNPIGNHVSQAIINGANGTGIHRDGGTPFKIGTDGNRAIQIMHINGTDVGSIDVSGSATSYTTSSDYRLKTDAQPMTGASARVLALKPVNFQWISDGSRTDGFLAHEAQAVVPEAITGTKDAMQDEEYQASAATGDIYTPATNEADEVIHSANAEQPETLEDGQQWRETTPAVMRTRSVPDMQGIDQSKLVPLLVASLQEALARITVLENA